MESIKLGDSYLSKEELKDVMQLVANKRNIKNYKSKSKDKLNKTFKKQSKNKERIDNIREDLKDLSYKLSKSELKEIKKNLYNIEDRQKINSKNTNKYIDELNKKIHKLEKYNVHDDYEYKEIEDIKGLFNLSIGKDYLKPVLAKSGYNKNYVQYESKGEKILAPKEYLTLIEKYLIELINQYKSEGEWKMQLIVEISFISLKPGSDETRIMHTRSDNEEFMNGSDTDEVIKLLFESFLQKYEENLQDKMRGSDFEFDSINFVHYNFNKTSINTGGSYIDSAKWLKDKKSTINPKINDDKSR